MGQPMSDLVVEKNSLPTTKQNNFETETIWTHVPDAGELLMHHPHIFNKTGT